MFNSYVKLPEGKSSQWNPSFPSPRTGEIEFAEFLRAFEKQRGGAQDRRRGAAECES
jgi:hypothetical protein